MRLGVKKTIIITVTFCVTTSVLKPDQIGQFDREWIMCLVQRFLKPDASLNMLKTNNPVGLTDFA